MILCYILVALFLGFGIWLILNAAIFRDASFAQSSAIRRIAGWEKDSKDLWQIPLLQKATAFAARFVFLEEGARDRLSKRLSRAGLNVTPEEFTARKYIIFAVTGVCAAFCVLLKFWFGIVLVALFAVLLLMKQKEAVESKLKAHDEAIAMEMPRFVRTVCRNLIGNRDVFAAVQSYRKVAGETLGTELDSLLAHMRSGNTVTALQAFEQRIGSDEAFRLCSALLEIERGIDQTATLDYLADDMARKAKYSIQKELAKKPAKMRRTYFPAVAVCVLMIFYVLGQFILSQLNGMF